MLFKGNKVTHLEGHGKITGPNEVSVLGPDGSVQDVSNFNLLHFMFNVYMKKR